MKNIIALCATALVLASCASAPVQEPFTVDLNSPRCAAGSAELQADKAFGGIKKTGVDIFYYPDDDAVCLEFRVGVVTYCQFWSREGREAFVAALGRYSADYQQRNLVAKSAKTKRAYGKAQGYIAWFSFRAFTEWARGVAAIEIGYTFRENNPFFSITQGSVDYKDSATSKIKTSSAMTLYLTRAQAEVIAALFNQEYLDGLERTGGAKPEGLRGILRDILNAR
ncbi:MAG: hypothetical protein LBG95_04505 [Treponema sp.]|jgi:hypothetical protein|nr:hypothetical protein [Treponema sp.]